MMTSEVFATQGQRFRFSSLPDLIRASIRLERVRARRMGCRVKSGDDDPNLHHDQNLLDGHIMS
jgi:hypothetical protein